VEVATADRGTTPGGTGPEAYLTSSSADMAGVQVARLATNDGTKGELVERTSSYANALDTSSKDRTSVDSVDRAASYNNALDVQEADGADIHLAESAVNYEVVDFTAGGGSGVGGSGVGSGTDYAAQGANVGAMATELVDATAVNTKTETFRAQRASNLGGPGLDLESSAVGTDHAQRASNGAGGGYAMFDPEEHAGGGVDAAGVGLNRPYETEAVPYDSTLTMPGHGTSTAERGTVYSEAQAASSSTETFTSQRVNNFSPPTSPTNKSVPMPQDPGRARVDAATKEREGLEEEERRLSLHGGADKLETDTLYRPHRYSISAQLRRTSSLDNLLAKEGASRDDMGDSIASKAMPAEPSAFDAAVGKLFNHGTAQQSSNTDTVELTAPTGDDGALAVTEL